VSANANQGQLLPAHISHVKLLPATAYSAMPATANISLCQPMPADSLATEHLLKGRLSTVDLLIKVACFVTKVNNIFNIKAADLN
jgi:hypothetical protein